MRLLGERGQSIGPRPKAEWQLMEPPPGNMEGNLFASWTPVRRSRVTTVTGSLAWATVLFPCEAGKPPPRATLRFLKSSQRIWDKLSLHKETVGTKGWRS